MGRVKPGDRWPCSASRLPQHRTLPPSCPASASRLNLGYVSRLQIPLPEKEEQSHIARILATVQGKLNAEEARRRSLEVLFESALQNLTTGALRVGDVPLAEPAWSH